MSRRVLIFFLVLILYVSLSNAIKTITVNETELVSLLPKARDEDADILSYSFTEPLNEEGKWQTGYGDAGDYKITVAVSDGKSSTSEDVLLVVKKRNVKPNIDSFSPLESDLRIKEGEGIYFNVEAADLNKDALSYKWEFNGNLVSEEKSYSYEADYGDAGEHRISVKVSDGEEEEKKEWIINVDKVDRLALLDRIKGVEVEEGKSVKLDLPDFEAYNLEYSISEPIGNDNYWETGYYDEGIYTVEVTIKDRDFSASKMVDVEIIDKDRKPIFKPIATSWMEENQKVRIELEANDPDGDKIEFFVENMPEGASLEENKFEWIAGYDTVKKESGLNKVLDKFHLLYKPFRITFIAKSKGAEVRQSALIIVKDVNRAPVLRVDPITVNEGEEVVIKPEAEDPDGDIVTYSYSGWIDVDRYMTDYDDAGTYKVKVVVTDGFLTDEKFVTIEVKDVNRAPIFKDIPSIEMNENERLELRLFASDPEGDSVEISSESLPRNSTMENNVFIWTPDYSTVSDDLGVFKIDFTASDGKDVTVKQANVTVYNANRAPRIKAASKKDITVKKGQKVKFEVAAEDLDGDKLGYVWKFGLLEQYKADSTIIRTFTSTGDKKVRAVVSDGKDKAEYVFNVKVV